MRRIFIILFLLPAMQIAAFATADSDTLLTILREELQADMKELQRQEIKPYFMSFRAAENYSVQISSSFGALQVSTEMRQRSFTPQIRVGSPQLDNFKFETQGSGSGRGGSAATLPLDCSSPASIRQNIWAETLRRYKIAQDRLTQAISRSRTQVDNEDTAGCFSQAPMETYYEESLANYALSDETVRLWESRLNRVSAVFRQWKDFSSASVNLVYQAERSWIINTEGTSIVKNNVTVRVMLSAEMKADDGMQLPLYEDFMSFDIDSLPSEEVLIASAQRIGERLVALSKAPVADPYSGPAIMSGPASGVFFHEIFGHRLEAHRMKSGGQTFKKMVGERILPETFQVFCDPTISKYRGSNLWGNYKYDDEGVRARRVDNVVNGVLRNFLVSRVPIDGFPQSNGHGRTANGGDAVSRQSNLIVETTKAYTESQLRKMLCDEARRQGKEYGYYFKSVTSGYTLTGEGGSLNSFNVTPLEVLRVYVDGRPDELVRGVDMIGTPLSMFSNIVAGGDTPSTFVGQCGAESGWVSVTATSPMIFVSKIETQRREKARNLPPILRAPALSREPQVAPTTQTELDDVIFRAMADEMQRSRDSLQLGSYSKPFYYNYTISRALPFQTSAELGAVTFSRPLLWQYGASVQAKLGDYHSTSDPRPEQMYYNSGYTCNADYDTHRRTLWNLTDMTYKSSIQLQANKKNRLAKYPLPPAEAALDDLQPLPAVTCVTQRQTTTVPKEKIEHLAARLSRIFLSYPTLTNSHVNIYGQLQDIYRLTSEGQRLKTPYDWIEVSVSANTRTKGGVPMNDTFYAPYTSFEALMADTADLYARIVKMADLLVARASAPTTDGDYYAGPVLMESTQIPYNLLQTYVQPMLIANRDYLQSSALNAAKIGRKVMDSRLTLRQLTDSVYNGEPLFGYYAVDAYGVRPQAMTLVENGILRKQMCGPVPALKTNGSTGNMRHSNDWGYRALSSSVSPGILRLTASKTQSTSRLRKQLLKAAKSEGYDYAYIVRRDKGMTKADLYRVDVRTGKETLYFIPEISFSTDKWRRLEGISSEEQVLNTRQINENAVTLITPAAILFDGIEVPAPSLRPEAPPALTYPLQR
ncbi:MAG: hypothetical protein K6F94_05285 [Bacteroidaceae bacterium]|nr:hypothetical protein [Bacteroidaceae bacterium]